jgi:indole-3-glycerol phosphate synthase
MSRLEEIFAHKRLEVAGRKAQLPQAEVERLALLAPPPLDFVARLKAPVLSRATAASSGHPVGPETRPGVPPMALIAEIKRASPSRGPLAPSLDPVGLARLYAGAGAAAISVLTDGRFFQGSLEDLKTVAQAGTGLPVLRKDFIFDPYQVYEARLAGADAVLLIVAGLAPEALHELHDLVLSLGMAPLVEVHNLDELHAALACSPILMGINNRNLHDFSVDLRTSLALRPYVPPGICAVAESGIHTSTDVRLLAEAGFDAILVGEALVTAGDIPARVRSLLWYT